MTELLPVTVIVNGETRSAMVEPRTLLADFLRHDLSLTGTHVGCEQGVCGACTVRIEGELARSCLTFAVQVDGLEVATVEGMTSGSTLHPIQEAFHAEHGLQCGFCTPGLLLTIERLLELTPNPSEKEIRDFISGNVCRCTGYNGIVAATVLAARLMGENRERATSSEEQV
jgi:aerobic carbon-monoxide dehydrogenase small subunit